MFIVGSQYSVHSSGRAASGKSIVTAAAPDDGFNNNVDCLNVDNERTNRHRTLNTYLLWRERLGLHPSSSSNIPDPGNIPQQ